MHSLRYTKFLCVCFWNSNLTGYRVFIFAQFDNPRQSIEKKDNMDYKCSDPDSNKEYKLKGGINASIRHDWRRETYALVRLLSLLST